MILRKSIVLLAALLVASTAFFTAPGGIIFTQETPKTLRIVADRSKFHIGAIEPKHESVPGFQVHLNGASASNDRDTRLIWSVYDTQDQSYMNPSLFGQLIFWDAAAK
jgi:hypothetical protein